MPSLAFVLGAVLVGTGCEASRTNTPPALAEAEGPLVFAERQATAHDPHASVFVRTGQGAADCMYEALTTSRSLSEQVLACPGAEEFRWDGSRLPASPRQRVMWRKLAYEHVADCQVLRNAASWLAVRDHPELDRRLAPNDPERVERYRHSGVIAQVASQAHALEAVQCAAQVLGPLPARLDALHGLWLYRAGWIFLYAGKMTAYQRVHAELARRQGALDRFVFAHLKGLEAIRAGDLPLAERMLIESVTREPEELHESLAGPSLLVREFWVRERVDVVVDYLELYATRSGDETWAHTTLESVLAGRLPDGGWF